MANLQNNEIISCQDCSDTIDLFHSVFAHACIGHVKRYFSIIGETSHRWGKWILSY